jgi:saccharopine dehydrogenase-like NADP-dependent oxidoreductase
MAKIIVLGAGMVGRAMAADLARAHTVTSADINETALRELSDAHPVSPLPLDISELSLLQKTVSEFDLVIGAVPGFMGYRTLEAVIDAGKSIVDISFCPEDALVLDSLARERDVTAIVDMGVAPGMGNVILGHHDAHMTVQSFECLVGGLPKKRKWPFAYKAPFSPVDVIEEYTRPARYVENGTVVTRPALSDAELVQFDEVATLEAFNTDGLRSLLATMPHIPNMKEKTLRYPGHIKLIKALQAAGFFATEPIKIKDAEFSPLEFTSRILIDEWKLSCEDPEFTVMRVTIAGEEDGQARQYLYQLYDEYDAATQTSSMARTTGYTCTAGAELVLQGLYSEKGVSPPEYVGRHDDCFEFIMRYLALRGVNYRVDATSGKVE